jgi:capsid assembly protease
MTRHNRHDLYSVLSGPLMLDPRALPRLIDEVRYDFMANASGKGVMLADERELPKVNVSLYDWDGMAMVGEQETTGRAPGSLLAVVPISGVITRHGYSGWFSSAAGTLEIGRHLKALDRDDAVGSIVLSINSPGGSVWGTPELARIVREIREAGNTRIVAAVDPMMASAATYIGTAAEKVYCIESGDVGSIGVINSYTDYSAWLEKAGIKTEYFRVPEKKARFTGDEPMDDDMRATMQKGVSDWYERFVADMATNRNVSEQVVKDKFGGGEMMSAKDGVENGLIDGIRTIDEVLSDLASGAQAKKREYMRKRAALQLEEANKKPGLIAEESPETANA